MAANDPFLLRIQVVIVNFTMSGETNEAFAMMKRKLGQRIRLKYFQLIIPLCYSRAKK